MTLKSNIRNLFSRNNPQFYSQYYCFFPKTFNSVFAQVCDKKPVYFDSVMQDH